MKFLNISFFRLYFIVTIIYVILVFYKLIPVMFLPAITSGDIVNYKTSTYKYKNKNGFTTTAKIKTPVIRYVVNGKTYEIEGGPDGINIGTKVDVIYNRFFPEYGIQGTFMGMLSEKMITIGFTIWMLFSGLAFTYSERKFFTFSKPLSKIRFLLYFCLILGFPVLSWTDYFVFGKITKGEIIFDDNIYGKMYLRFDYWGEKTTLDLYKKRNQEYEEGDVYVAYKRYDPNNAQLFNLDTIYSDFHKGIIAILLVALLIWYHYSNIPNPK